MSTQNAGLQQSRFFPYPADFIGQVAVRSTATCPIKSGEERSDEQSELGKATATVTLPQP